MWFIVLPLVFLFSGQTAVAGSIQIVPQDVRLPQKVYCFGNQFHYELEQLQRNAYQLTLIETGQLTIDHAPLDCHFSDEANSNLFVCTSINGRAIASVYTVLKSTESVDAHGPRVRNMKSSLLELVINTRVAPGNFQSRTITVPLNINYPSVTVCATKE